MEYWRTCLVDNVRYEYCSHCDRFNKEETWRYMYCSENCMGIYGVCNKYRAGKISADDAVTEFENYKMPPVSKLHKLIKPIIIEIYLSLDKDESGY